MIIFEESQETERGQISDVASPRAYHVVSFLK